MTRIPRKGVLANALVVLILALATPAQGQAVHIVDGDGNGDFVQVQDAVTAAADGDVILVRRLRVGRYDAVTIINKSLTIIGDDSAPPLLEDVRIESLAADKVVSLRSLGIEGRSEESVPGVQSYHGIVLFNNDGCVWLEDLVVDGANGWPQSTYEQGLRGAVIRVSECVVAVDSSFRGGFGSYGAGPGSGRPGGDGGFIDLSQTAFHGCTFIGGEGGWDEANPGQGGTGLDCATSTVFISGSTLTGGDSGPGARHADPTSPGLAARESAAVTHLATSFESGGGDAPHGAPVTITGFSSVEDLDDTQRAFKLPAPVRSGKQALATYSGAPGDLVLLQISPSPDWTLDEPLKGVQHLSVLTDAVFLGAAGPAGSFDVSFRGPQLPPGVEAATGFAQPLVAETGGALRLGAPSAIVFVDGSIPGP